MTATFVLVLRIGLAVILYYFLWRVIQTLRRDLKQQGSSLSGQEKPSIHIYVKDIDGQETRFNFWQAEILIGRGSKCDISLKDDALSASHARLSYHHAQWWLEDLGSTNGTFLNKDQITTPTVVISDDQIKCGHTILRLNIDRLETQIPEQQITESEGDE